MKEFKNLAEIKEFCKENDISVAQGDKKDDLLDKIKAWESASSVKKNPEGEFTAAEFGQLHKIEQVGIKYLTKVFGNEKNSYKNWIRICKDKKVID